MWPSAPGAVPMGRYQRGGWMLAAARGAPPAARRLTVSHRARLGGHAQASRQHGQGSPAGTGGASGRQSAPGSPAMAESADRPVGGLGCSR